MLRKWKVIVPLALTAAGAVASGLAVLMQKLPKDASPAPEPAPAARPANLRTGVYSFISGYQDAATVELSMDYDPEKFSFAIVEDEFLNYSSASHVAIVYGEEFNLQLEYAAYYSGEDFALLTQELSSRHPDLDQAVYGGLSGVKFRDGDNFCLAFPVPEDVHSYLLITLVKAPDNDDELETIPEAPDFRGLLNSASFRRV